MGYLTLQDITEKTDQQLADQESLPDAARFVSNGPTLGQMRRARRWIKTEVQNRKMIDERHPGRRVPNSSCVRVP